MGLRYSFMACHVICVVFEWLPHMSSVHGRASKLDCFQWLGERKPQCVWEPGSSTNISRFKLLVEAPHVVKKTCTEYKITGISVELKLTRKTGNMVAYVVEKGLNCTMATFSGSLAHFFRCAAANVELQWRSGKLFVNTSWNKGHDVQRYLVKYREYSANNSNFSTELSQHKQYHTTENLNSSVSYDVQVQCINSSKCTQCTPSEVFTVPRELTRAPVMKCTLDGFHLERRKVIISWESPSPQFVTQHSVRVQKASEEFVDTYTMESRGSSISLSLSHSAYYVHLYSSNNVSQSPSATCTIEPALKDIGIKGTIRVAFNSNQSFNLTWSGNLTNAYECYTVEWLLKGGNATGFRSFYSDKNQTVIDIEEGTSHKAPVSYPQNVSHSNITDRSVTISWLPVPEEELQGFLRGYIIYYVNGNTKSNITLSPGISSYRLFGLKSGSDYQVEVAALTSKGEGKRSPTLYFGTNLSDHSGWILGGVIGSAVLLVAVHLCFRLLNRVKEVLWPSIPNPSNSSAIQKISPGYELEPMMVTNGQKLQEHVDSGPLYLTESRKENQRNAEVSHLIAKQNGDASSLSFCNESMARASNGIEKPECLHSTEMTVTEVGSSPLECATTEFDSPDILNTPLDRTEVAAAAATALASCDPRPTVTFMSDYTTMELFQQATMSVQAECHPCPPVSLMPKCPVPTGLDYVDQSHFYTP